MFPFPTNIYTQYEQGLFSAYVKVKQGKVKTDQLNSMRAGFGCNVAWYFQNTTAASVLDVCKYDLPRWTVMIGAASKRKVLSEPGVIELKGALE